MTGTLTLNFQNDPTAAFVFQIASTLTTASSSTVAVENGISGGAYGVYWQVGSSATLNTSSTFVGNILAQTSITLDTTAKIACGRAIALTGAVTMDTNSISNDCLSENFTVPLSAGPSDYGSLGFSGSPTGGGSTPVPEPGSRLVLAIGLAGIAVATARRVTA